MKTALIYHPIFLQHDTGPHHPERASRLQAILRKLEKTRLIDKLKLIEPKAATIEDIVSVHAKDYVLRVKEHGPGNLDPDTVISKDSFDAALFAAGAVIKGIDLVVRGYADNAFCLVRPPGHHAGPSQAMGFCIFNNVAIGARHVLRKHGLKRVAIIDWDVHHGNGTEEIFYNDQSVFYISLHQYPHYPGTGQTSSPFNLNIPMPGGSGDKEYIKAFKEAIIPKLKDFNPEFILISAGFDGHKDDPLSSINLTEPGYHEMTCLIKDIAPIVSVLEGGYNLLSLANSAYSHLEALLS